MTGCPAVGSATRYSSCYARSRCKRSRLAELSPGHTAFRGLSCRKRSGLGSPAGTAGRSEWLSPWLRPSVYSSRLKDRQGRSDGHRRGQCEMRSCAEFIRPDITGRAIRPRVAALVNGGQLALAWSMADFRQQGNVVVRHWPGWLYPAQARPV